MKSLTCLFIGLLVYFSASAQYVSLSKTELNRLTQLSAKNDTVKAFIEDFKRQADKALKDKPNPIEKVRSQGLLQGNPIKTASLKAVEDASKIYALAFTSKLYSKEPYLSKAREYLLSWAKINQATGDPIDETKLEDAIVGYDLIRKDINSEHRRIIDKWLESIADSQVNSAYANPKKSTSKNNWNSHRIKVITLIAHTIHNKRFDSFIETELKSQLSKNLYADGSGFDFHERDALHYHVYTLEPLLKAIIVLDRALGENYFLYESETKSSIKKSVDFLVPYVSGEKTHVEFANSKVGFDKARANNNEKGYQPSNFVSTKGIIVLSLACWFDSSYISVINHSVGENSFLDWQLVLNKVRKAR